MNITFNKMSHHKVNKEDQVKQKTSLMAIAILARIKKLKFLSAVTWTFGYILETLAGQGFA